MATFGAIASAAPNVLFDAAKLDRDVQGFQRNQLLMQNAQQDQQQQGYARDTEARIGLARQLSNMPEDQAAAAWGTERARLQAAGFGRDLPEQFPGLERLRSVAASDLTTFQRLQIEEKKRASEALMGALGGIVGGGAPMGQAPAMPVSMGAPLPTVGAAPIGGGTVRAGNANAAALRDEAMRTLEGPALERRLAEISSGRATALTGQGPDTNYRANPGVNGVFAGLPAPAPGVPVLASAPTQGAGGGLTPQQRALIMAQAASNPQGAIAMAGQFAQQNTMAQERALDNQRADRQFQAQESQRGDANRRAEEQLRLTREAAERSERAANRQAEMAGVPSGYRRNAAGGLEAIPGGPADKPPETQATEAERKAAGFLGRMESAEGILAKIVAPTDKEGEGYNPNGSNWDWWATRVPVGGNYLTTEPGQRYLNAAAEWARAKLRLESGAVIGDDEAREEARTYFPMPGDSAATVAQKRQLRITAMEGVRRQAGRAGGGVPAGGSAPNADASGASASSTQGGGWSIRPVQ